METLLLGMEAARPIFAAYQAAPPTPFLRLDSQYSTFLRKSPNFLSLTSPPRPLSHLLSLAADTSPGYTTEDGEETLVEDVENLRHKTLILENLHRTRKLKNLLRNLSGGGVATAAAMNGDELWIAVNFFIQNSRHGDALHLFDEWRLTSPSRSSPSNFSRMALLLSSSPSIPQILSLLSSMADLDFPIPISLYNSLLSSLAKANQFDEMGKLLKRMKSSGSNPNSSTFNLLIVEFARAGLLRKMESAHRSILSMKMSLLPSSIAAMVKAYADVTDIPKMEKMYRRLLSSSSSSSSSSSRSRHAMVQAYTEDGEIPKMEKIYRRSSLTSSLSSSSSSSSRSRHAMVEAYTEDGEVPKMEKTNWRSSSSSSSSSRFRHAMVEAYTKDGEIPKMEKIYWRSSSSSPFSSSSSSSSRSRHAMVKAYTEDREIPNMKKIYRRSSSSSSLSSSSSSISRHAMVKAYTEDGEVPNMEKIYRRSSSSSSSSSLSSSSSSRCGLSEDLIRMMAMVYIKNLMFSRLEDLGNDLAAKWGRTNLVWLLLLLSSALILSRRGMDSILKEMTSSMVDDDVSFINILAMAHAKMKGFRDLEDLFMKIGEIGDLGPDLVTIGVFFDACSCGFDGGRVLDAWMRRGFLERKVEMATDSLIVAGFGKGRFVESCEELFVVRGDHDDDDRDDGMRKEWTYAELIRRVFESGKLIG